MFGSGEGSVEEGGDRFGGDGGAAARLNFLARFDYGLVKLRTIKLKRTRASSPSGNAVYKFLNIVAVQRRRSLSVVDIHLNVAHKWDLELRAWGTTLIEDRLHLLIKC